MSTILVADDMALCREPIAEALRRHGHTVLCAADGFEALKVIHEAHPDLVLLDVNMPGLDGIATLRAIRRNRDSMATPVVLLTERTERESIMEAARCGVQGYILKSKFSLDQLLERVGACLGDKSTSGEKGLQAQCLTKENGSSNAAISVAPPPAGRTPPRTTAAPARAVAPPKSAASTPAAPGPGSSEPQPAAVLCGDRLLARLCKGLELKPLSATVQSIMVATSSSECSADDVARAAKNDQAICVRMLRIANSSSYSRGHAAGNVKAAVQRLGIQEVRKLVMTLDVLENYSSAAGSRIDPRLFWEHSLACGLIAAAIAKTRRDKAADDYFLWGILHDVGRLIMLSQIPERYASLTDSARESGLPLDQCEAQTLQLDHCQVLAKALEHWKFPREFIVPITSHHLTAQKLERISPEFRDAAMTVALADRLAHAMLLGDSGNQTIYPFDDLIDLLKLDASALMRNLETIETETNDLKLALLAHTDARTWPTLAGILRDRLPKPLGCLCVSLRPETDAFRLFFERLAPPTPGESPNCGVIYSPDNEHQPELTAKFEAAEREAGCKDLPVLCVSDEAASQGLRAWAGARNHQILKPPIGIDQLLAALGQLVTPSLS